MFYIHMSRRRRVHARVYTHAYTKVYARVDTCLDTNMPIHVSMRMTIRMCIPIDVGGLVLEALARFPRLGRGLGCLLFHLVAHVRGRVC